MSRGAGGVLDKAVSEAQLVDKIIHTAQLAGWLCMHQRPARTDRGWRTAVQGDAGFPDIVLVHAERRLVLILECKSERGVLDPMQKTWLAGFEACGLPARVVRPRDWPRLERVLVGGG